MLLSRLSWLSRDIIVTCDIVVIMTWDHIYQQFLKMCPGPVQPQISLNSQGPKVIKENFLTFIAGFKPLCMF